MRDSNRPYVQCANDKRDEPETVGCRFARVQKTIADQHSDGRSNEDRNDVDHRSKAGHGKRLQSESIRLVHKARSRAVDRGDLPLREDLLVRLTVFAPRCRDSSIAATLSASPTPSRADSSTTTSSTTPSDRLGFDRTQASNSPPQTAHHRRRRAQR